MPFGWAAAATAVAGVAGSALSSHAVGSAQDSANQAAAQARDQARADAAPWTAAGSNALGVAADLSGANGPDAATTAMANYQPSPGYQWQLGQGLRAVDAGAAAKGLLRSGATLKAEEAYGQGLAAQDFGTYYNRLSGLATLGQAAAAGQAAASTTAGTNISQTDASAGAAQAGLYGNTASGLGNIANNYANQSLYQSRTNALSGGGGGAYATQPYVNNTLQGNTIMSAYG